MKHLWYILPLLFILSCEDDKDTTPPELTIVSPTSGSTIGEIVQIKVQTTDESGILKVDFYIQNSIVLSDTTLPYEYEWNTTTNQDGEYKVKVVSFDTEENFVEIEVSVTVDNESKKPTPSQIDTVIYDYINKSFSIKWTENKETDFKSYTIYESDLEDMSSKTKLLVVTNSTQLIHTVGVENSMYKYYQIETEDVWGLKSQSEVKEGNSFIIVFHSNRDGDEELYLMSLDGTIQKKLTDNVGRDVNIFSRYFSPNGENIVFNSQSGQREDIYIIYDFDGSDKRNLTSDMGGNVNGWNLSFNPVFTPDGKKILFISNVNESSEGCCDIYIMGLSGQNLHNLTKDLKVNSNSRFHFSPNSSTIIYTKIGSSIDPDQKGIWTVDGIGNNPKQLTTNGYDPSLSSDGSKIVYVSESNSNWDDIHMMDSDGSNKVNLTNDDYHNSHPVISPDGSKILYTSFQSNSVGLYIMNSDGSNKLKISDGECYYPDFTPDGSKILFGSHEPSGDFSNIYLMNIDGTNKVNITNTTTSWNRSPQFRPR